MADDLAGMERIENRYLEGFVAKRASREKQLLLGCHTSLPIGCLPLREASAKNPTRGPPVFRMPRQRACQFPAGGLSRDRVAERRPADLRPCLAVGKRSITHGSQESVHAGADLSSKAVLLAEHRRLVALPPPEQAKSWPKVHGSTPKTLQKRLQLTFVLR